MERWLSLAKKHGFTSAELGSLSTIKSIDWKDKDGKRPHQESSSPRSIVLDDGTITFPETPVRLNSSKLASTGTQPVSKRDSPPIYEWTFSALLSLLPAFAVFTATVAFLDGPLPSVEISTSTIIRSFVFWSNAMRKFLLKQIRCNITNSKRNPETGYGSTFGLAAHGWDHREVKLRIIYLYFYQNLCRRRWTETALRKSSDGEVLLSVLFFWGGLTVTASVANFFFWSLCIILSRKVDCDAWCIHMPVISAVNLCKMILNCCYPSPLPLTPKYPSWGI